MYKLSANKTVPVCELHTYFNNFLNCEKFNYNYFYFFRQQPIIILFTRVDVEFRALYLKSIIIPVFSAVFGIFMIFVVLQTYLQNFHFLKSELLESTAQVLVHKCLTTATYFLFINQIF